MPALKIIVTNAGYYALRNAEGNGTAPVVIASIGVTATAFVPDRLQTVLPGEIKRLTSIKGGATALDTLHVTMRDDSADTYSLRGIGLYLADGTLFGVFGQAAVLLEKSTQAAALLAVDVIFADVNAASLTLGDTNFNLNQATTEKLGLIEVATDAESADGTDPQRAVPPRGLLAALNARLGVGAPSSFFKPLLSLASAAAIRLALEIKGAALKDMGSGNGLDADLLDGQHGAYYRAWVNLTGVPQTFPSAPHSHSAADITSGTLAVARGGTGVGSITAGSYVIGAGTAAVTSKTPAQVLVDIGAAEKAHSHVQGDVIGLVAALAAKAPLSSPLLTGAPTAPTPASTDNSTRLATTAYVQAKLNEIVNGSPGALDTLKELADALGDDPNFAATVTNAIALKAPLDSPALKGTPTAPTPAAGDSSLKLSTTAFVAGAVAPKANAADVVKKVGDVMTGALTAPKLTSTGDLVSGQNFISSTAALVVAPTGVGSVYLRPNGWNTSTGQSILGADGNWTMAGSINVSYVGNFGTMIRVGTATSEGQIFFGADDWYIFSNANNMGFYSQANNYGLRLAKATKQVSIFGGLDVVGAVVAAGGFQSSDRRLKTNIKPRKVQRGIALRLARMFCEWDRIADGRHDVGLVAQCVKRLARRYVIRHPDNRYYAIDKAGLALEAGMDNALQLQEHAATLADLFRRLDKLENAA